MRAAFTSTAILLVLLAQTPSLAHYPFPCSPEEKEKAARIERAVDAGSQASVATLTELLGGENARVRTAALLGVMRLSHAPLDFASAVSATEGLKDSKHDFELAAAEAALILLDEETPVEDRRAQLVELTESKEGHHRRMAVEALRHVGDASVLPALEALADDGFGDHDDSFDMKAVGRVAFNAWWSIRSAQLPEEEKLRVLVDTLRLGEPFRSRWCDAACDLLETEGEKVVPLLIPVARGEDRRSKLWAVRTLRYIGSRDAVRTLVDVCVEDLESEDQLVRQSSAYALAECAEKRALPALANALARSRDPLVRERAALAIGRIDDEGTVPLLKAALSDPDEAVKTRAAAQLARRGLPDGDQVLLDALGRREGSAGYIAADAMAYIQDQDRLAERLVELLQRQPGEAGLSERQRLLLTESRNRVLRQLAGWDVEKLRPIAPALRPVLEQQHRSGLAKGILKKLDD